MNSRKDYKSLGMIVLKTQPPPNSHKLRKSLKHNLAKPREAILIQLPKVATAETGYWAGGNFGLALSSLSDTSIEDV